MRRADLLPWQQAMLVLGGGLALTALAAVILRRGEGLAGWLGAAVAFSSVPAGSLYLVLMMRLIPGPWGEEMRLSAESATLLTPLAALLFVPVMLGTGALYPWANGETHSLFQQHYLTPPGFAARTAIRFGILWWVAARMRARRATGATAAAGLVVLPLLAFIVSVDWLMSLDPGYASSAFGLQFLTREIGIAFCAALLLRLSVATPPPHIGISGGVLLTLLLIWAYIEFLPFFIAWSPNLPESAAWYLDRSGGAWPAAIWGFALLGAIPLFLLLFARMRQSARALKLFAAMVLIGKMIEIAWLALPGEGGFAALVYGLALAGWGAVAVALLPWALRRRVGTRAPERRR